MSNDSPDNITPYDKLRNKLVGIKREADDGTIDEKEADKKRSRAMADFNEEELSIAENKNKEITDILLKHDLKLLGRGSREFDVIKDAIYCAIEVWEKENRVCMIETIQNIVLNGIIVNK